MLNRLYTALDNGQLKEIFDHIKNYLVCAFLLTIGTSQLSQNSDLILELAPGSFAGYGIIGLSVVLMILNLIDGIRKIAKSKNHVVWLIVLILIYAFVSIRIIEMAWYFRGFSMGLS